jgi:hypothetical protein
MDAVAELAKSCAEDWLLLSERIAGRTAEYEVDEDIG